MSRNLLWRAISILSLGLLALAPGGSLTSLVAHAASVPVQVASAGRARVQCDDNGPLCTETFDGKNYEGQYTGHDEPSLLFYSNVPGSGNSSIYHLTLPKDPPTLPKQDGTGGTFNFQLHPAFWFGMAMCDTQSSPEFTNTCTPDSDTNIFDSSDPNAPDYIGHHPGTAFMEMQFYPPGWVAWPPGVSCDATKWCAALNIDSLSINLNTNQNNNNACRNAVGDEPVNFAFITKSGVADSPADPQNGAHFSINPSTELFMNSNDRLTVDLHDTPAGFQVVIHDLTNGETGSMTASLANGFAQIKFDPSASTCTSLPYAFHPMYSTASEHTRVPWAAHTYNIAFSDEIGHFEYCNHANTGKFPFKCNQAGVTDPAGVDGDDFFCFNRADSTRIQIGGCIDTDADFDGPEYSFTWPGSLTNGAIDSQLNPRPIQFSSPLFEPVGQGQAELRNYGRVAFEADLPRIEFATNPPCQRHVFNPADPNPGQGCVNPPVGASFYPFYTTGQGGSGGDNQDNGGGCLWQLGGANIPGTTNTFGGSSTAEYGPLLLSAYPAVGGPTLRYNNFRQVLSSNPCPASASD
jgi:hypothetical protein